MQTPKSKKKKEKEKATPGMQHEVGRLLTPRQVAAMAEQLLRSNRMDANETEQLFAVVRGDAIGTTKVRRKNCTNRESNPGHKHGKLVCYHYTTSAVC